MHDDKELGVVKDIRVTLDRDSTRVYDGHHLNRDRAQVGIRHELGRPLHLQQRRNVQLGQRYVDMICSRQLGPLACS